MSVSVGIGLAFVAMLCWGFGDFLIQRSTRKVGIWETLFIISLIQFFLLLPFVWKEVPSLIVAGGFAYTILFTTSLVLFVGALVEFESLRRGKISAIEPAWSVEIPVAALLAFMVLNEKIGYLQILFIVTLIISLVMLALREKHITRKFLLERGIMIGLLGGAIMGGANFFMGWGGRVTSPMLINWFTDLFMILVTGGYLVYRNKFTQVIVDFKNNYRLLIPMSLFDGVAWLSFTVAMVMTPIAIATALSESYIIVAVLLGLLISKEKLYIHQKWGLAGAIFSAVILAIITGGA